MQAVENQKYVQYCLWDDDYSLLLLSLNNGMTGTGIYVAFRGIERYSITLQSIVHCMQQGESGPSQPLYGSGDGRSCNFVTLLHDYLGGRWVFYDSIGMYIMYKPSHRN